MAYMSPRNRDEMKRMWRYVTSAMARGEFGGGIVTVTEEATA